MAIEKKNAWEKYPQGPEREKLLHLQRITEGLYPAARQSASARHQFMLTPQDTAL